jgi:ankyrin repeat protein
MHTFPLYLASGEVNEFEKFVFALLIEYPEALLQDGWQKLYFNPLHLACMHNRPDLVTLILKHNSSLLNSVTVHGITPLLLACKREFVHIVDILFQFPHLDVNKKVSNWSGETVLHNASHKIIPKLFECNGINVDIRDDFNKTPFQCYLENLNKNWTEQTEKNEKLGIIDLYLNKYPWVVDAEWKTSSWHPDQFYDTLSDTDDSESENNTQNMFHFIAKMKNIDILKRVAPYLANKINDSDSCGFTPFHIACGALDTYSAANRELIDIDFLDWFLHNEFCDKNRVTNVGFTAMHYACYYHNVQIVGKLLKLPNIILDIHDQNGETPLQQLFHNINIILSDEDSSDNDSFNEHVNHDREHDKLQAVLEILILMLETGVQVNTKSCHRRSLSILDKAIKVKNAMAEKIHRDGINGVVYQENMHLMNIIIDTLYSYEVQRRWKMYNFLVDNYLEETFDDD